MPGAEDEPMLTRRCDDIGGVDGVIVEIGVPVTGTGACPAVLTLVRGRAGHEAVVRPVARFRGGGFAHADEGPFAPGAVERLGGLLAALDVVVHHYAVVHAKALFPAHGDCADDRSPVAVCDVGSADGVEPHLLPDFIEPYGNP